MSVWFRFFPAIVLLIPTLLLPVKRADAQTLDCNSTSSPFYLADVADKSYMTTARFATVLDYRDSITFLNMDIYRPGSQGDNTLNGKKPAMIILYGGGFKQRGSTRSPFIVDLAQYLARKGFVVSAANYRVGWENGNRPFCTGTTLNQFEDAMYRAQQDVRAAVRHLKANAESLRIDTSRIFVFGLSAGAIAALGTLYEDADWMTPERAARLGDIDRTGNDHPVSSRVAGAISLAGAFTGRDVNFYGPSPVMFLHGTCDNAVLFNEGKLVSCSQTTWLYGPAPGATMLDDAGICYESHIFCGFDHNLSTKGVLPGNLPLTMDYIKTAISEFTYKAMCQQCFSREIIVNEVIAAEPEAKCSNLANYTYCNDVENIDKLQIAIEPNYIFFIDRAFIHAISEKDRKLNIKLYNMLGQKAAEFSVNIAAGANKLRFPADRLQGGQYQVHFYEGGQLVHSQKLLVESCAHKY
jgi:acetyl esterase/lipase